MKLDFLLNYDFFTGVPDSRLRPLCDWLIDRYGVGNPHHVIAANEGNAVALAAGYHLATGKIPVVYLQNSGEGNIVNPVASLLSPDVYGIPCLFIVGWRGEPGLKDEPQHAYQGKITLETLALMEIAAFVLTKETEEEALKEFLSSAEALFAEGKSAAIVVRDGALTFEKKLNYRNGYTLTREEAVRIVTAKDRGTFVSTTGKTSRELFEIREMRKEGHARDFLTVGSMGHASSIAFGIALQRPEERVWCIDGDGAALMHMGAMAVIGAQKPKNFVHVVINNEAHESVGGMPTALCGVDLAAAAKAFGYRAGYDVESAEALESALAEIDGKEGPILLEIRCAIGSRANLGRPTATPKQNKEAFMERLRSKK